MPDEIFLEDWGLFKPYDSEDYFLNGFTSPPINIFCEKCELVRTFNPSSGLLRIGDSGLEYVIYKCAACNYKVTFILYEGQEIFEEDLPGMPYIMKVCQWPRLRPIDKKIQKSLKDNLTYYKKGLYCEQEGFGIGAFAYYRRIVENEMDRLLDALYSMFTPDEKEKYGPDLTRAKEEQVAQKKIEIIKEILPSHLRPGGVNPLAKLHSSLSAGLHARSEEECLGVVTK